MSEEEKEAPVKEGEEQPKPEVDDKETEAKGGPVKKRDGLGGNTFLNILDHGDSGVGKTRFCGTMIQAGLKVLYVVFNEDELMTLDQMGIKGYDYWVIKDYEKDLWKLYLGLRKNNPGYDGFIIDGITDLQQAAKDYELGASGNSLKFTEEAMKGRKRMFLQNWGNLLEMTRHFLDPILKLPMHKIMTAVSEPDDDPKTGKTKIYPMLQGSLQQIISAHFSVVAYSYVAHWGSDLHYCLTTQSHPQIATKDRTGLNRVQINPTFQTFIDALEGKASKPTKREKELAGALIVKPQASGPKGGDSKD